MGTYAVIETGGEQLRVEPGRFYDVRYFTSLEPEELDKNIEVSINRVLLVRHESAINPGNPWLKGATVKGRILQLCKGKKLVIYKMRSKKKMRRKLGYRQHFARFVVDAICLDGEEFYE
uniref:Large ribosomal subunit protein bL21c n=2 Tax=Ophioglossum TaxID=13833 RepID=L7T4U5_9MONI|nr:ribosomal protein L21 [Ophioglossum californicum]AGC26756.1 ribosomal protein L21 [Ophioglossum californicum]QXF60129.1 ribosomal protein L21 [Ophioglossum vulgatum]